MSEQTFNNVKITSSFEVPETRENLVSGETIGQHFGKIAKVIDDLKNGKISCPANGGNADTVGGKPISDLASADDNYWLYTYAANGNKHGAAHRIKATHNVKSDSRFCLQCESGVEVRVDFATDADTLDGYHAADLIAAGGEAGHISGSIVFSSTLQTVTLGFQPSAILCIGSTIKGISSAVDVPDIQNSLIINNDTAKTLVCGCKTVSGGSVGNSSVDVTITRTSTGFTAQTENSTYSQPPVIDYIAFK